MALGSEGHHSLYDGNHGSTMTRDSVKHSTSQPAERKHNEKRHYSEFLRGGRHQWSNEFHWHTLSITPISPDLLTCRAAMSGLPYMRLLTTTPTIGAT